MSTGTCLLRFAILIAYEFKIIIKLLFLVLFSDHKVILVQIYLY